MGIRPFGMRFQKFDQFRNSGILHITKVRFSEDWGCESWLDDKYVRVIGSIKCHCFNFSGKNELM